MPSKSSDQELVRKLNKVISSINFQPEFICAAGEPDFAPFNMPPSGSHVVDDCIEAYSTAFAKPSQN